jgi:predicted metal-dependent HD superfamily phosphohydrolase
MESILENTSMFVKDLFKQKLPDWAVYHDLSHTIETVNSCEEIGRKSGLKEENLELLKIAAWFHDTGYLNKVEGHEEKSSEIALNFLTARNFPNNKITKVINCIMATKISTQPSDLIESVICDSDLISLGSPDYLKKNDLLKTEIELREKKRINDLAWLKRSLNFLSIHRYQTEYAQNKFGPRLEENIKILQKMIDKYH